jgi:hypothetical protein
MPVASVFSSSFRKVYGKPCWGVRQGYGSFLTLEFGKPRIVVREPTVASKNVTEKTRRTLARRLVYPRGQWHLWIYRCEWEVLFRGKRVGRSSTNTEIRHAVDFLNGQKLLRFSILPRKLRCSFSFDLGGTLITQPFDKEGEQWLLFRKGPRLKGRRTLQALPVRRGRRQAGLEFGLNSE